MEGEGIKKVRTVKIHKSEVSSEDTKNAVALVQEAMDKFQIEKDMATYVKKKCDEMFTGTWHCVIGRNFGCSLTHDTKYVMFFQVDLMNVLLFRSLE